MKSRQCSVEDKVCQNGVASVDLVALGDDQPRLASVKDWGCINFSVEE
jgi:hypothetical protein